MNPFKPQLVEQMKKRVKWAMTSFNKNPDEELYLRHQFDFTDGTRIFIARERDKVQPYIRIISCNLNINRKFQEKEFLDLVLEHVVELLGRIPSRSFDVQTKENVMEIIFPQEPKGLADAILPANPMLN